MDAWNGASGGNDSYSLWVNSVNVYSKLYVMGTNSSTNICGNSADPDYITTVTINSISHSLSNITLLLETGLGENSTQESFGFKNIVITVYAICTSECVDCYGNEISQCYSCNSPYFLSGSTCVTACPSDYWGDPSGRVCSSIFSYSFISL